MSQTSGLFSIGHSSHPTEKFLSLLTEHDIDVLVDVRSSPYSRYAPQYRINDLREAVRAVGIRYLYLGKELGGRPQADEYYDEAGYVLYWKLARSAPFLEATQRLLEGINEGYRIALMCSEENPTDCHRRLLVGRALADHGVQLEHIRGGGRLQSEKHLKAEARASGAVVEQPSLFPQVEETRTWTSTQSVSQRKRQKNSSGS